MKMERSIRNHSMTDENDDDVPLLNEDDDDDEQIITPDDRPPTVEAIFVVTFDVKHGNTIEFQLPEKERLPLNDVEYKALPSGSHHITQDYVYFRHGTHYGLACLARADLSMDDDGAALSVIAQSQRGLRIKSVGILTSSIQYIQSYLPFLRIEAETYLHQPMIDYDRLKGLLIQSSDSVTVPSTIYETSFMDFLQQFGAWIFPLARLILLNKRILLYSSPPVGSLCDAVYFLHLINPAVNPLFFLSVSDLPRLTQEQSYIGCVTERIFKEKTSLYDVFIDCTEQNRTNHRELVFHTNDPILQSIVKITRNDRNRFKETITWNNFVKMGDRLSEVMDRLGRSTNNHSLNKEDFQSLHLHQRCDRLFINEYIRIHQISHVTVSQSPSFVLPSSPCCNCSVV